MPIPNFIYATIGFDTVHTVHNKYFMVILKKYYKKPKKYLQYKCIAWLCVTYLTYNWNFC